MYEEKLSSLKKIGIKVEKNEFEEIMNLYNNIFLFLLEIGVIKDNDFSNRWQFMDKDLSFINNSYKDNNNYKIFKIVVYLKRNNLCHLFPVHHLYWVSGRRELIQELDFYLSINIRFDHEKFISEYIENNTYTMSNIIEDAYKDLMINRFVDSKYKRIIELFKNIYDKYQTIPSSVDTDLFEWFFNVLYLHIVIDKKIDNLDEVLMNLDYICSHILEITDIINMYNPRFNREMYLLVKSLYRTNDKPRIIVK